MSDPSLLPWSIVWVCLAVLPSAVVLTWHGIGQRNPSRVAGLGFWLIGLAIVSAVSVTAINAGGLVATAFSHRIQEVATHRQDEGAAH